MNIAPIQMDIARILSASNVRPASAGVGATGTAIQDFGKLLSRAIEATSEAQQDADSAITRLAAGEPVDVHQVMIAMEKAEITTQLATEVRNKLVEAYQEVMRMQV